MFMPISKRSSKSQSISALMKLQIECFRKDSNVNLNFWDLKIFKGFLKGFKEAGIYKAINDTQEVFERVENPFRA